MSFPSLNFKAGSYAMIEGEKDSEKFFIILKGQLRAHKASPVVGEEDSQTLGPGDFFGVESAMARQSRIETVIAVTDCTLIEVSADNFGELIKKSAPIALKIIRSFSMKLREFDSIITRITFRNVNEDDPKYLFQLAEFWFNSSNPDKASYAYQRYLQCVPGGEFTKKAVLRLQGLGRSLQAQPLVSNSLSRNFEADKLIFCEHEPGYELYVIRSGRVKITKMVDGQEVMLALLQPGDIFGEMALLDNKPRTATAVTSDSVTLMTINKVNFENMVKEQPQLATKLITLLSSRIWMAYKQLANLMIEDPVSRLLDMLLTIIERNRTPIIPRTTHAFDFGTSDLLKMVGLNPKSDEQYLLSLFKNRWLRLEHGRIICVDLIELQKHVSMIRKQVLSNRKKFSPDKKR